MIGTQNLTIEGLFIGMSIFVSIRTFHLVCKGRWRSPIQMMTWVVFSVSPNSIRNLMPGSNIIKTHNISRAHPTFLTIRSQKFHCMLVIWSSGTISCLTAMGLITHHSHDWHRTFPCPWRMKMISKQCKHVSTPGKKTHLHLTPFSLAIRAELKNNASNLLISRPLGANSSEWSTGDNNSAVSNASDTLWEL